MDVSVSIPCSVGVKSSGMAAQAEYDWRDITGEDISVLRRLGTDERQTYLQEELEKDFPRDADGRLIIADESETIIFKSNRAPFQIKELYIPGPGNKVAFRDFPARAVKPLSYAFLRYREAFMQEALEEITEADNCLVLQAQKLQKGKITQEALKGIVDQSFDELYGPSSDLDPDANPYICDFPFNRKTS